MDNTDQTNKQTQLVKRRIEYLDIAKAILIFLVICAHSADVTDYVKFEQVIYSFHMPAFFLISGMFLKAKDNYTIKSWYNIILKNVKAILFPALVWALIYAPNPFGTFGYIAYGTRESLAFAKTLSSLWFIPVLFVARIIEEVIIASAKKYNWNRRITATVFMLIFFIVGLNLPSSAMTGGLGWVWGINVSLVATGFMLVGYLLFSYLEILNKKKLRLTFLLLLVSIFLFVIEMIFLKYEGAYNFMFMANSFYGNHLTFVLNSLTGTAIVLLLSMILSRLQFNKKLINYVGQSTLGIFFVHKKITFPLYSWMLSLNTSIPMTLLKILCGIITLFLSLIIVRIIEYVMPQLIGKDKNKIVIPTEK